MSRITEKSPKDCASKQSLLNPHCFNKKLFIYLSTLSLIFFFSIFLVWLILHPSKPEFSIEHATVLNLSRSSILHSSIHLTVQSHNPNKRAGIYYDSISAHASYMGQRITPEAQISNALYQDHEETNVLSAYLVGNQLFVGPLLSDQASGNLGLGFEIIGKLRWRVGSWESGTKMFNVKCATTMPFGDGSSSEVVVGYIQGTECDTVTVVSTLDILEMGSAVGN